MVCFASLIMKIIVVCSGWSRFPVKLICCIAFGLVSSDCCLLKSIAIKLKLKPYFQKKILPSRQRLFPRTSRGRPPPTSPGRPLKILFDRPGDVLIWRPGEVPIGRAGDVLKWRPGDVLTWCTRDDPGRLIRDVPRTFSARPLGDLESTKTWMSKIFFNFSFRT